MKLENFKAALNRYRDQIPPATFWRYTNGQLPPPLGDLLLSDPDLVEALARDVRAKEQDNAENTTAIERDAA